MALVDYPSKNNFYIFYDFNTQQLKINNANNTFKIKLFSILGQKVLDTQLKGTLDISQLKKGLYFYTLDTDKIMFKGKLLIY